jgi:peptidyl-prolyl cis-trans isomerase D
MPGITVTETELKSFYDGAKDRYLLEPEKVNAQQILIKYDRQFESEEAKKQALALITEIREKALAPNADFGALAKERSESGTRDSGAGGELGWFIRQADKERFPAMQAMAKEIEDAAFSLKVGEISEPVLTDAGFNLIKVIGHEPAKYAPFEEVKDQVAEALRHTKALALAVEKAQALKTAAGGGQGLEAAASAAGKEVLRSEFFQEADENIFRLPDSKPLIDAAFKLEPHQLSDPVPAEDHVYLFTVCEIKEAREGSLSEVRDRVVEKLKPAVQLAAAQARAAEYLTQLKKGDLDLARLAEQAQAEVKTTELTERYLLSLPELGYSDTLGAEVAAMTLEQPWPQNPITIAEHVVIIHLLDTEAPDMSKFEQDKQFFTRFLLSQKQTRFLDQWVKSLGEGKVTYTDEWEKIKSEK